MIAASLVSAVRRQLIESGLWEAVREASIARDPIAAEWLDTPLTGDWVPFARHLHMMRALCDVVGESGAREVGRERLHLALRGGVLAPVLRGWMRSYAGAPAQLLRVAPHAWKAVFRHAGHMELVPSGEREVRFRVEDVPASILECEPWHRFLEGYGCGMLEAGSYAGAASVRRADASDALEIRFSW